MTKRASYLAAIGAILFLDGAMMNSAVAGESKHVVLVGASVGEGWRINELPNRVGSSSYTFEYIGEYQFDKSEAIKRLIERSQKPDAVILKECAVYFPGEFESQKWFVQRWIDELERHGVVPIPATIVPVTTPTFATVAYVKNIVKKVLPLGKIPVEERQRYIEAYNDWVRTYAAERGLTVLDLEAALRRSDADRRLRPELTSGDGLHLNERAYQRLDQAIMPTLDRVRWSP